MSSGAHPQQHQAQPSSAVAATRSPSHHHHQQYHDNNQQQQQTIESVNMSKAMAQYTLGARLRAIFEQSGESGRSFDYLQSMIKTSNTTTTAPDGHEITAYLSKMQHGGHIQPFGCTLAVHEPTFRIIAYSENSPDMLGLNNNSPSHSITVPNLADKVSETDQNLTIGTDVRTLFTPSSSVLIEKAFAAHEITLLNPVWIHSKYSGKPFHAILHRVDVGVVIDLEPATTEDPALSIARAVQSQKLAVQAISHLQSLPHGDIKLLCDTVVKSVRELTGYDRVMVYKFHEDGHGEVVAESKRADLEPYIGLHYPTTDIPQASRFLFKQNRVRMIVDCHASLVRIVQDEGLMQPLSLLGSTLRAPHLCHSQYMANMGSIASLVLAVIINGSEDGAASSVGGRNSMKLWGLVICHHTSARCIPFALRYACEFLMQAFGLQLEKELQLASQLSEESNLKAIVNSQLGDLELQRMDDLSSVAREMVRLIETVSVPIFAVDVDGRINGWNAKVAELTGLSIEKAMWKSLVYDLVYKESRETVDGAHNSIVTARAGKEPFSSLVSGLVTIGPRFGGSIDDAARYLKDAYDANLTPYEFVESMSKGIRVPGIGNRTKKGDNRDKRVELLKYMEYAVQVET